jgi:multiple sugar transport system permease protein
VFAFSEAWANFIWPLVVVTTKDMYTTSSASRPISASSNRIRPDLGLVAVISILPMLVVFALLRSHIMKGIATSGLRG